MIDLYVGVLRNEKLVEVFKRLHKMSEQVSKKFRTSEKEMLLSFNEISLIIKSGDCDELNEIIKDGRIDDVNMLNNYVFPAQTLLSVACRSGFVSCAEVLIDNEAYFKPYGTNIVLESACLSDNVDMVNLILSSGYEVTDECLLKLFSNKEIASNTKIADILLVLIKDANYSQVHRGSFLFWSSAAGNLSATQALLARGATQLPSALRGASAGGYVLVVNLILCEAKARPDSWITPEEMREVLVTAANGGHTDVMKMLIEHGADAEALNSALCRAVTCDVVEVVELLIDSGADVNVIRPRAQTTTSQSPLVIACRDGILAVIRLLLIRGADPNDRRATPPLKAALHRPGVVRVLLEHGANANLHFTDGNTAILTVLEHIKVTSLDAFTILLQHGADPNLAKARTGETPLMVAAKTCLIEHVRLLLERGADVTQKNAAGKTVLDMLGKTQKYSEVVELCTRYIETNKPGAKLVLK